METLLQKPELDRETQNKVGFMAFIRQLTDDFAVTYKNKHTTTIFIEILIA
jgi:hypothetical protein